MIPSPLFGLPIQGASVRKPTSAPGAVRFLIRRVASLPSGGDLPVLPQPTPSPIVRWRRTPRSYLIHWEDTARLQVTDGTLVRIESIPPATAVIPQVLNLAIALALTQRGFAILHGGAVSRDGIAAVILGAPGAGKSALVLAGARQGLQVVSDEIVPLRAVRDGVSCPGGNPLIRVDSLLIRRDQAPPGGPSGASKVQVDVRRLGLQHARGPRRIATFLFLGPRLRAGTDPFRLEVLEPVAALTRLIDHSYARRILADADLRLQLRVCAKAARSARCYILSIRHGLEHVDLAARHLGELLPAGAGNHTQRIGVRARDR